MTTSASPASGQADGVIETSAYTAELAGGTPAESGPDPAARVTGGRLALCIPLAVATIALAMVPPAQFPGWQWVSLLLAAPVATWGAWPLHRAAWRGLGHGAATMDTLVSLGVTAAFTWSVYALLFGGAGRVGLRMPFTLTFGLAGGQMIYFEAAAGVTAAVLAGRYLEARAGARSGAGVTRLVTEALASEARSERIADRVAAVFVPCVIALAVVTLGLWLGTGLPAAGAWSASASVLVVACPCALGLAIPAALLAAVGRGAELGVLVGSPQSLETVGHVNALVLDKAGIAVGDQPRPGAAAAISRLGRLGLRLFVLTGDSCDAAAALATQLGIPREHVFGDTQPAGKAGVVRELQDSGYTVAMVGDSVSDAAALAAADLGMAMAAGADAAIVASDLTLTSTNPGVIADAVELARATRAIVRTNLAWALGYNVIAIPLAALGYLNPLFAGIAMSGSSLVVVSNSLLLRRFRPDKARR
jgi:P-type Cu+ transporter